MFNGNACVLVTIAVHRCVAYSFFYLFILYLTIFFCLFIRTRTQTTSSLIGARVAFVRGSAVPRRGGDRPPVCQRSAKCGGVAPDTTHGCCVREANWPREQLLIMTVVSRIAVTASCSYGSSLFSPV